MWELLIEPRSIGVGDPLEYSRTRRMPAKGNQDQNWSIAQRWIRCSIIDLGIGLIGAQNNLSAALITPAAPCDGAR